MSGIGARPPAALRECGAMLMRRTLCAAWAAAAAGFAVAVRAGEFDFGPIVSRDRDVFGNDRFRALGPFVESRRGAGGADMFALRPLWSTEHKPGKDETQAESLWPVFYSTRSGKETNWRLALIVTWRDADRTDPRSQYRLWVLPFWFMGRNEEGGDYFALFPIGGRICDILGNDETMFALFPLYGYGRTGGLRTWNVLWPLGAWGRSERMEKFRAAPFYGYVKRPGQYEKKFVLWPFWTEADYEYPGSSGGAYLLFPLFGRVNLESQESWSVLPPLFRFSLRGSTKLYYMPWPFVQAERGAVNKTYLWPLAGAKSAYNNKSWFLFWPLITAHEELGPRRGYSRLWIVPVWYSAESFEKGADTGGYTNKVESRNVKLWPLLSYTQQNERSRLRVLGLLPFKDTERIERCYAPLWTLYGRERNGSDVEDELLWGMASWRRGAERRKLALFPLFSSRSDQSEDASDFWMLGGLFRYSRRKSERKYSLFYFLNWTRAAAPPEE